MSYDKIPPNTLRTEYWAKNRVENAFSAGNLAICQGVFCLDKVGVACLGENLVISLDRIPGDFSFILFKQFRQIAYER